MPGFFYTQCFITLNIIQDSLNKKAPLSIYMKLKLFIGLIFSILSNHKPISEQSKK